MSDGISRPRPDTVDSIEHRTIDANENDSRGDELINSKRTALVEKGEGKERTTVLSAATDQKGGWGAGGAKRNYRGTRSPREA